MLTVFVCEGTSCEDRTSASAAITDPILNVDKEYIGSFSVDAEETVIGGSGGSSPLKPDAEYDTIVSQFGLGGGSLVSYLAVAIATATMPFVMAYFFLGLHQAWLRQRVTRGPGPAGAASNGNNSARGVTGFRGGVAGAGGSYSGESKQDEAPSGRQGEVKQQGGCCVRRITTVREPGKSGASCSRMIDSNLGMVLVAGLAALAFVVMLPLAILGHEDEGVLHGFDEGFALSCPTCINGVPSAEYLEATPVAADSHTVRVTLMTQAARATVLTIPSKKHLFEAGSTDVLKNSSFSPTVVSGER